jgi:hypothetical protein
MRKVAPRLTRAVLLAPLALVALAGVSLAASYPLHAQPLPGRVVEVRAGEFFFQAPDTIPAGLTTFELRNVGMMAERHRAGVRGRALVAEGSDGTHGAHMLWIVKLEDGKRVSDLYEAARRGERLTPWATQLGGPGGAYPPRMSNATLLLEPGQYALVCYIGSAREDRTRYHLLKGMFRALTVTPAPAPPLPLPPPDVVARITGEGTVTFSTPLVAGRQVIRVENTTDRGHEFKFHRMPAGTTGAEFLAQPPGAEPGTPWSGLAEVPANGAVTTTIGFEPGEYVLGMRPAIRHRTSQVVRVR